MTLTRKHPMKRGKGLSRVPIPRKARPPIKGKRRKPGEMERIYGPKARREFVKSLPCAFCTAVHPVFALMAKPNGCHQAHTVTGGMGRKADYTTIIPLCPTHHRKYDDHVHPFDKPEVRDALKALAAKVEAMWQAYSHSRKSA